MFISQLKLESFKSYENLTIKFDKQFNVIIGENNIGKSTIFEALQLWKKCYDLSIVSSGNKFYSPKSPLYISFEDLHFIRLSSDADILFPSKTTCSLEVAFKDENINKTYSLKFSLTKPNIKNAYFRIVRGDEQGFDELLSRLSELNIKPRDFIFIHQTSPISNVLSKEPYMYKGQVIKKIQKGKSDEVLRNKIIQSLEQGSDLKEWMKNVLDISFDFVLPKRGDRDKSEYINLLVEKDGSKLEIYLQGSGFLQIAEIFSTIKVMNNALNILLIDEPDSHISPRLQTRLLDCLKSISETQTIIISHNDNFVADVCPEHILFINDESKNDGTVKPLDYLNIDILHNELGGIVSGLTKLQKYKNVFFVEGEDDITYIKHLSEALKRIESQYKIEMEKLSFWFIRGKDDLQIKIMSGKQLLSQAISNCKFNVIYDKDFSTTAANTAFISNQIQRRLGRNSVVHVHNGYCIESVLFSNLDLLKNYLRKTINVARQIGENNENYNNGFNLSEFIDSYMNELTQDIKTVTSDVYSDMNKRFDSQKTIKRNELQNVMFSEYAAEASENVQFLMNKSNMSNFVIKLEQEVGFKVFVRCDDEAETIAACLLNGYFDSIENDDDIYPDFVRLINDLS